MGTRREARERALALLYEMDVRDERLEDALAALPTALDAYVIGLLEGIESCRDDLDELIQRHAEHWSLSRMAVIDRNVLRLAAYELGYRPEVSAATVITEAVELAKQYSTDESGRFVNGVLGALAAELRGADT